MHSISNHTAAPADFFLCSDLDRTLLPNGEEKESPQARPLLRALAKHPGLTLAYVSGRNLDQLQAAISEYALPVPDYAVGDAGTNIYTVKKDENAWESWWDWEAEIAQDWHGFHRPEVAVLLMGTEGLRLQPPSRQNIYKLSYYASMDIDREQMSAAIKKRLAGCKISVSLSWSVDDLEQKTLLDVVPARATKFHAVEFLMARLGFSKARTVFAGDSGNDLSALTGGLQAVLVKNARKEIRKAAQDKARAQGFEDKLYLAKGGFLGLNGNYASGVLEGLAHFLPEIQMKTL
ncbi:MAG: HAD-IIB family hydrolase [Gammaproteobacteria bacterium]|nr:HAD-IIB family hydrolase [Gammaproteobacteria bacterium]